MRKMLLGTLLILSLLLVGCNGGGGGGGYGISSGTVNSFVHMLEAHYGGDFSVVKSPSESASEGFVVVYDSWGRDYLAFDIYDYVPGQSLNQYLASTEYQPIMIHDIYTSTWGETMYVGDAYYRYGGYAGEFVFEEKEVTGKDLEKLGAFQEAYNVAKIAEGLNSEYGFSTDRSSQVAKMSIAWKKLSGTREMTEGDTAQFTKELIGKELSDAQNILKKVSEGDNATYDQFIKDAAAFNGTHPEQIKDFIDTHILNQ